MAEAYKTENHNPRINKGIFEPYPLCHTTKRQKLWKTKGKKQKANKASTIFGTLVKERECEAMHMILTVSNFSQLGKNMLLLRFSKVTTSLIYPMYFSKKLSANCTQRFIIPRWIVQVSLRFSQNTVPTLLSGHFSTSLWESKDLDRVWHLLILTV